MTDGERDPTPLVILGRTIGTYLDWDSGDTSEGYQVYDFVPLDKFFDLFITDYNTLFLNFGSGMIEQYDDDGTLQRSLDMIDMLRYVPRDPPDVFNPDWPTPELSGVAELQFEEWPTITAADVRKAHNFPEPDPVIDALKSAGMEIAFVLEPGAPKEEVQAALNIVSGNTPPWPSEVRKVDDASMFGSDDAGKGGWGNKGDG
jgi:hypothetical protein